MNDKFNATKLFCATVQCDDRKIRKKAYKDFKHFITNQTITDEDVHKMFNETHIYILNGFRDKSEPVREEAIKFVLIFLNVLPKNDYYLSYIFPVLVERLGTSEIVEESEEIRLQLVNLIEAIIERYKDNYKLKPFLNNLVTILCETVRDKYPAIKEVSCRSVVNLAKALPRDFHLQAESLVKPVLTNFGHQRYKIRCEAINCIGEIILHSTYKGLDEVIGPMAERLFDQIPVVRRCVAQVAAKWLLEYRDRYSFFYKLLPLILTGLNDEVVETREEAQKLWIQIGLQYQNENEEDLKDQLDYMTAPPKHYLPNVQRPNLGCRVLVQRNVSKLAKAMSNELLSWRADIRVRCAQLLCSVVLHAEEGITHNLQNLLPSIYTAARDEDKRVADNVIRASNIIGLFVPVETWKQIILPAIEDGAHFGHLAVLSALISGSPNDCIAFHLDEISKSLAEKNIRDSRKTKYQIELVNCTVALMDKCDVSSPSYAFGKNVFTTLVTVLALKSPENYEINTSLLDKLCKVLNLNNRYELWSRYLPGLLKQSNVDPRAWTAVTTERCIFEIILTESGEAFGENLKQIGGILVESLNKENDPESRLKIFMALTKAMDSKDVTFKRANDDLNVFLQVLVAEVFVPSLVWSAGRTAEAMRTMAASCLFSALTRDEKVQLFAGEEASRALLDQLLALLISLTQDASYRSRQLALQNLVLLKNICVNGDAWRLDDLLKVYPEVVKRLDDPVDKVRLCAVDSLRFLFEDAPDDMKTDTFRSHHNYLIDTLLVHFDDEDEAMQESIVAVLKTLSAFCWKSLTDKLDKHGHVLRNQKGRDTVIKYLSELNLNEGTLSK